MRKIAIIPARGGSKRIPRKNIKNFLGKPIIAYSIEVALNSGLFDEVMVSTDDEEIADTAIRYGANVPFLRSLASSNDFSPTVMVLQEVLNRYKDLGKDYEYGCCIYPTAPLIKASNLQEAYNMLINQERDTVFPVLKYSYPIWRSLKLEDGKVVMNWPEHLNSRSQDLVPAYHDAGQFYWFDTTYLLNRGTLFSSNSGALELEETQVQDIDNLVDWKMAEMKYQFLQAGLTTLKNE